LGAAGDEGKEGVGMKPWRGYHGFGKLGEGKREIMEKARERACERRERALEKKRGLLCFGIFEA